MSPFQKLPKDEDVLTLTVNSRLARWLLLEHNEKQKALGYHVWPTPEILPLTIWLKQVWMQSWPEKYILTELQSERLWGKIVQQDPKQNIQDLLHLKETAKMATEANTLIREHRLPIDKAGYFPTEESKAFNKWKALYESRLKQLGALDPASAMDEVCEAMLKGEIKIPAEILFAGFEEITPQFQAWLDFLRDQQVTIRFSPEIQDPNPLPLKSLASGKSIAVRKYADKKEEAVHCARWVRANYQPGQKVGVVVIDLQSYRSLLKRELSAELAPASVCPWMDKELPFNISLGPTLWEQPMINIAAQILSIHVPDVPLQAFTSILNSPYLNVGQTRSTEVHALERKLCRRKSLTVYFSEVMEWFEKSDSSPLAHLLVGWKNHLKENESRLPSQWGQFFSEFLKTFGWPLAGRTLTSREFQVYEAWKSCLDEFATLDSILEAVSRHKAIDTLLLMLKTKEFQTKTSDHPIQVVGLLESSGMRFDHLWVMGCSAEALPALPSPNPFLPIEIRKRHDLPHSTAQRELEFAENSVRRLVASSNNIVFSYPGQEKNVELKISPLLTTFPPLALESTEDSSELVSHCLKDQFPLEPNLQIFEEPTILSITESERNLYKETGPGGGYSFIKDQAECPFRAFARHRLNAQQEEFPELDFDHQERGTLVHKALEIFWKQTRTQEALFKLHQENLLEVSVKDSIQQALKRNASEVSRQGLFYQLELERVHNLIMEWLSVEMKRSPFEVVDLEKEDHLEISGLKFRLRIDRTDKTADGKVLLIDYKTGTVAPAGWFGERIQEPQLPLYAFQTSPDAIAFAQVKKGSHKLQGALDTSFSDQGLIRVNFENFSQCSTWDDQLESWRFNLKALADEFIEGQTEVSPLKGQATCKHCDLQTLCRISEKTQGSYDMEDEE
ncbi:MAG: PD-(D/E)XK nuclease family protein [Nitrospinae bacterium]|nr:PD-(D/E)XK nuclease family protein [Nitrospinota bacterium]MDA1108191.1 PD-(D/E)XK nuclease family protein [Nitrospinota bacterium]